MKCKHNKVKKYIYLIFLHKNGEKCEGSGGGWDGKEVKGKAGEAGQEVFLSVVSVTLCNC